MLATLTATSPAAQLDLTVQGLRSAKGMLRICVTRSPDHFPDCPGDPAARKITVSATQPHLHLADLAPGDYAVALFHDENGNGKLDKRFGMPAEGIGFSRNPRMTFGPPKFAAARFAVSGQELTETVRMKYFL